MKSRATWIGCIVAALFCGPAANASVIMTLEQAGPDVVATGSGTIDLAGLSFLGMGSASPEILPGNGALVEGNGGMYHTYLSVSGPTSFGPGVLSYASSGTGDPLLIYGAAAHIVAVPVGYVSGTPLSSTATWNNTTLAVLGVTTGTYTWTWGSGADADSLTLYAGVPAPGSVPEPASAVLLTLGAAGLALTTQRHRTLSRKR